MKVLSVVSCFCLGVISVSMLPGSQTLDEARQLERVGDAMRARAVLARAAQAAPNDVTALSEYAEFLDRYGDPACRDAYRKLLDAMEQSGDSARQGARCRTVDGAGSAGRR